MVLILVCYFGLVCCRVRGWFCCGVLVCLACLLLQLVCVFLGVPIWFMFVGLLFMICCLLGCGFLIWFRFGCG